jgi:hypothetical protein
MAVLIHWEGVSLPQTTPFYQLPGDKSGYPKDQFTHPANQRECERCLTMDAKQTCRCERHALRRLQARGDDVPTKTGGWQEVTYRLTQPMYPEPGMKPQPISLRDYHQPDNRVRQQLCNMQARDGDQSSADAGDHPNHICCSLADHQPRQQRSSDEPKQIGRELDRPGRFHCLSSRILYPRTRKWGTGT